MENYYHWIEQYIDGDLQGEQLAFFRRELIKNPRLADEFFLRWEINKALSEFDIIKLRAHMESIFQQMLNDAFMEKRFLDRKKKMKYFSKGKIIKLKTQYKSE